MHRRDPTPLATGGASWGPLRRFRLGSLYQQVRLARIWLPLTIVGVVLFHQLTLVPLGGPAYQFWAQLLFYSILGPIATFLTLDWIAGEVRLREEAQNRLTELYTELQESHELLGAIQQVTESFAGANDLEAALEAGTRGITEVTGALGASVTLGAGGLELRRDHGLDAELQGAAHTLAREVQAGRSPADGIEVGGEVVKVLSAPFVWGGSVEGSLHAFYRDQPDAKRSESFRILASEFSAAAEAARGRMRDLLTLYNVDRSIRAEGNLERLLAALLGQMMARVDATDGAVYLADGEQLLQPSVCRGATLPVQPVRIGEGFVGEVAAAGEPSLLRRIDAERRRTAPFLVGAGSAVALPLTGDEGLLGVMVLTHPEPERFDTGDLPILNLLAGQLSLAVGNARAYLQSEELAIAEERARIAREIHDGVAQSLAFAALKLDLVGRLLDRDLDKAREELAASRSTVRGAIREVRRSIFALRPIDLDRHGFTETLRRYADDYGQQNNVQVEVVLNDLPELPGKSEAVLFRIFQEAMNNVAKHAGAGRVQVTAGRDGEGGVFMRVADDGVGFDPERVADRVTSAGGLGLRQMRERIEARGGRLTIDAAPGRGTRVEAVMPA
jgi:signal transduction histidine kinase